MAQLIMKTTDTPETPPPGYVNIFVKTDGTINTKDENEEEKPVSAQKNTVIITATGTTVLSPDMDIIYSGDPRVI